MESDTQNIVTDSSSTSNGCDYASSQSKTNGNSSPKLFPESPVYEPEDDLLSGNGASGDKAVKLIEMAETKVGTPVSKRKLNVETAVTSSAKVQKLDLTEHEFIVSSQSLDDEVSQITNVSKKKDYEHLAVPSTSRVRSPAKSSPRRALKRSNSAEITKPTTPRTPRPASTGITKTPKRTRTPAKIQKAIIEVPEEKTIEKPAVEEIVISDSSSSRPSVEFVSEIKPASQIPETITEENSELEDSQNLHLELSDTEGDEKSKEKSDVKVEEKVNVKPTYSSDPVVAKDRREVIDAGKPHIPHSEGYNYSDLSSNASQQKTNIKEKSTDQDTTDSVGSISIESPDHVPTVASKLISKLSNGNSSTPTEISGGKMGPENSDNTPDMKLPSTKGKRGKNDSFRASNTTTPSTISPLQNGHSLPVNTPQVPVFEVHLSYNEDCEFLSLVVVRTDNDVGMDICKEYQRVSKRFTIDPYLADISVSTSPSSVTSGGMINLPNRTSFASTVSSNSTTSSNRTSDGNFVVPQPPRKSVSNPAVTVKGHDALMKKLQEIFSHIRESSVDEINRSLNEDKVSVAIQTSLSDATTMSNGNASPEEVGKCDKATPKSSLKKTRVRGRRPLAGKTKRAILPTQHEEPEYMHGMNSPEMVPTNGDNDTKMKSPKDEKPLSTLVGTPKSLSKLKQRKRPTSPRPDTPVEKAVVKTEYPGYPPDTVVLAKWVDKRYYSGRVLEILEPNKYMIRFDDGQTKALIDDFIIFGDMKTLPLQGQSVYALVDEEQNYEPGLVLEVEEGVNGTVTYKCTTDGDTMVMVTATELYLTEDQARSIKESVRARSPSTPLTPRRRHNRELDLDNIIQGPRSARSRDKGTSSARKRVASPKSPKASTSGLKTAKSTPGQRKRLASESSSISESSNCAPAARIEEVPGVEPEVQRTPRKVDGVKAGPLQLKGAAKQNIGKKNSKLTKFEMDEDTVSRLGPIHYNDKLFSGMHFLLTCADTPKKTSADTSKKTSADTPKNTSADTDKKETQDTRHYSSEEDSDATSAMVGTDTEDLEFSASPFNKERLKEQLEAGGGTVYSHFDDLPLSKYSSCKLIAPRPCLTAKYIACMAAGIRAVSHAWVIAACARRTAPDVDAYALPAGWSCVKEAFVNWIPPSGKRNTTFFKDKLILLCGDQDTFVKFWERVCTLAGANTRVVNEDNLNMTGAIALVTEWDCPHEVQNKANQDNIPLVSTTWVVQCLIEAKVLPPTGHPRFSFMYTEPE